MKENILDSILIFDDEGDAKCFTFLGDTLVKNYLFKEIESFKCLYFPLSFNMFSFYINLTIFN